MMTTEKIEAILGKYRIVPVVTLDNEEDALPLAKALVAGGLPVAEVTFRTLAAEASIRKMAEDEGLLVGAGTVLTVDQVDQAANAGAKFIVSPGFNPSVVSRCLEINMPIIPGVSNPTDIEMALGFGLKTLKFFPAEAFGGVATLKAISAPYRGVKFVPTGGINKKNLADYLALDQVLACGGSWMVSPQLFADHALARQEFSKVEATVKEAMEIVASTSS